MARAEGTARQQIGADRHPEEWDAGHRMRRQEITAEVGRLPTIAEALFISRRTATTHVGDVLARFGVEPSPLP